MDKSLLAIAALLCRSHPSPRKVRPQAKGPLGEIVSGAVGAATGTTGRHLGRRGTAESS
jgi:hypothetical protein